MANDETSLYLLLSKHLCQRRCHGPVMQAGLLVVCPLHKMTLNPAEGNDLKLTELEKPKGTQSVSRFCDLFYFIYSSLVFILSHLIFRATLTVYGGSQARSRIRAVATGLRHSHSHAKSEPCLQPTPQLRVMPDP